jgi:triacylglycerol esterase/lipase EstA (alpha/beta hydrolase family)
MSMGRDISWKYLTDRLVKVERSPQICQPSMNLSKPNNEMANTLILVHGFMDTGRRMAWMSKRLRAMGWKVLVPSLQPSNGTESIGKLAEQLNLYIRELILLLSAWVG